MAVLLCLVGTMWTLSWLGLGYELGRLRAELWDSGRDTYGPGEGGQHRKGTTGLNPSMAVTEPIKAVPRTLRRQQSTPRPHRP